MNKTALIVGLAIIAVGAILFFAFGGNDNMATNDMDTASTTQEVAAYNAIVNAQNQQNDQDQNDATPVTPTNRVTLGEIASGNIVTVAEAELTQPGYVVLYKVNSNGESSVVGNSDLLAAGTYTNIAIQLDAPVAAKQAIVATLHEDDGDKEFNYPESDGYLVGATGLVVNDIDVVGVSRSDREAQVLESQVEAYLEANFTASSTAN